MGDGRQGKAKDGKSGWLTKHPKHTKASLYKMFFSHV